MPRSKFFFFLRNVSYLFFFAIQIFLKFYLISNISKNFYLNINFNKYFFSNQLFKLLKKNTLSLVSFYDNNVIKSFSFWTHKILYSFFLNKSIFSINNDKFFIVLSDFFLITPIRLLNVSVINKYFKNIFFFLMFLFNKHSLIYTVNWKIPHTHILTQADNNFYPFYSSYFLNVYNF